MIEQGSPEWLALRCGKVTASRIADIIANGRGGQPSASRANYLAQLVAERLTCTVQESFINDAMRWGTEHEPIARAMYEIRNDVMVDQVDFIDHPAIAMSGASPDGLVGPDGLVEFKCPSTATHIETLLGGSIPGKYLYQMHWQMACTGRQWCDFVSFDPRMPDELQLFVQRVERPDLTALEAAVSAFLEEVSSTVIQLEEMRNK